jgi:hypothetical protein
MIERGGHSPHSAPATAAQVTAIVGDFLASLPTGGAYHPRVP